MIERSDDPRKKWPIAGIILMPLVAMLAWALWRAYPRDPDDPRELLRRAAAATSEAPGPRPTGKSIAVGTTSAAGEPVEGQLVELREESGRKGYGVHLAEPLKEGDSAVMKLPGGGSITVSRPVGGEATGPASAGKAP